VAETNLKVLHVASGDLWAGAEAQLFNLSKKLNDKSDVSLKVVLLNHGELENRLLNEGIDTVVITENSIGFVGILRALSQVCANWLPDIIHSHRFKENILVGLCSLRFSIPSVRTVHGASEIEISTFSLKGALHQLDLLIGKYVNKKVIAVSEDLKRNLIPGYRDEKIVVIRNGIGVSEQGSKASILPQKEFNIGIVGRLTPVKRVDVYLEVAKELLQSDLNVGLRFYVVGEGALWEELKQRSVSLGIQDNVTFTGHVANSEEYIRSFDCVLMTSSHEGTPMTLLECLRYKTPIIANDVGGICELLEGGKCGALISNNNIGEYVSHVKNTIKREAIVRMRTESGYSMLLNKYSSDVCAEAHVQLYKASVFV